MINLCRQIDNEQKYPGPNICPLINCMAASAGFRLTSPCAKIVKTECPRFNSRYDRMDNRNLFIWSPPAAGHDREVECDH